MFRIRTIPLVFSPLLFTALFLFGCAQKAPAPKIKAKSPEPVRAVSVSKEVSSEKAVALGDQNLLRHFPANDLSQVLTKMNVSLDKSVSLDKRGALKISIPEGDTVNVPLYELANPPAPATNGHYLVRARLLTEKDFKGQAFLDIAARQKPGADFKSRGIATGVSGDTKGEWATLISPFYPAKEEPAPQALRVSLTVVGPGTVWVDDVRVLTAALSKEELYKDSAVPYNQSQAPVQSVVKKETP